MDDVLGSLKAIRAVSKERQGSRIVGISVDHIFAMSFGLGSAVVAAMRRADGVVIPGAQQSANGAVTINLGAKGIIECELVASGERWGRGPARDVHSSLKAQVDSPVWHLVHALTALVRDEGNTPAIDGWVAGSEPKRRPSEVPYRLKPRRLSPMRGGNVCSSHRNRKRTAGLLYAVISARHRRGFT